MWGGRNEVPDQGLFPSPAIGTAFQPHVAYRGAYYDYLLRAAYDFVR